MIKRGLLFLLILFTAAFGWTDFSNHRMTIGSEPDYPPYCFVDEEGQAAGFSVELFLAAVEAMGVMADIRVDLWDTIKNDLAAGRLDALPLVGRTPEREKYFDFTIPYLSLHGGVVIREDAADIQTFEDLTGKTVAVMRGDNAEEFLRRRPRDFSIITTDTFLDALDMLSRGDCDAVVIQRLVALRLIREEGFDKLKVLDEPITDFKQDFCFAVREGDKELLALLNEGLALVMADGTFRRLQTKWFASYSLPSRKIIVGGDSNYPPFEFLDEKGRPAGYNVDLTRAIARELDMDIEFYLGPWSKVLGMFDRGEIDVLQGLLFSSRRNKLYDFSQAHTVNHGVAVTLEGKGVPPPESLEDLENLRLIVQEGDVLHDFALEQGLEENLAAVPTQEEALLRVLSGEYDCALAGRLTALYLIQKNGWDTLVTGKTPLLSSEYCFAVKKGRLSLLSNFSDGLSIIEETGEYRRIYQKWLGVYEPLPPTFADVFKYILLITGPLLIVLGLLYLWTRSLKRQVDRRTAELQESEEFQRAIIACSPVALYSIDLEGRVSLWNESAERVFGWTAEEISGKPLPIVPEEREGEYEALRREVFENGGFFGRELIRRRKGGSLFPVSLSAAPIKDEKGVVIGIVGAAEDISGRKKIEDELNKHRKHLEDLVAEKTKELNERIGDLERFHDVTINRELRMKELREEINRLRQKESP